MIESLDQVLELCGPGIGLGFALCIPVFGARCLLAAARRVLFVT